MRISARLLALIPLVSVAACAPQGAPDVSVKPDDSSTAEAMDRPTLVRAALNARPIRNMPPDHRYRNAYLGPEGRALFTGNPTRCVIVALTTPRGPNTTSFMIERTGPTTYKTVWHASGYELPTCGFRNTRLTSFPELEQHLLKVEFKPNAYCEELNGAMARPGAPWRCRDDGRRGFPSLHGR